VHDWLPAAVPAPHSQQESMLVTKISSLPPSRPSSPSLPPSPPYLLRDARLLPDADLEVVLERLQDVAQGLLRPEGEEGGREGGGRKRGRVNEWGS